MMLNPACLLLGLSLLLYLCDGTQSDEEIPLHIKQTPSFIWAQEGASINISCAVILHGKPAGINIMRRYREVMYFNEECKLFSRKGNEFADRSQVSGTAKNITISLHNLRKSDTDLYTCRSVVKTTGPTIVYGGGTVVIVADTVIVSDTVKESQTVAAVKFEHILLIGTAFVILILVVVILYKTRVNKSTKSHQRKCIPNTVYEDMSSSIRRNTMTRSLFNNEQNINGAMSSNNAANKNMGYSALGLGTSGMVYSTSPY